MSTGWSKTLSAPSLDCYGKQPIGRDYTTSGISSDLLLIVDEIVTILPSWFFPGDRKEENVFVTLVQVLIIFGTYEKVIRTFWSQVNEFHTILRSERQNWYHKEYKIEKNLINLLITTLVRLLSATWRDGWSWSVQEIYSYIKETPHLPFISKATKTEEWRSNKSLIRTL